MSTQVFLPQVTQGMTEGTIIRWLKKEGEAVKSLEPLYEMMTDKAATEVESPASGVLGKILVAEGEVPVGTAIAVILAPGEKLSEAAPAKPAAATAAAPAPAAAPVAAPAPSASAPAAAQAGRFRASPLARRIATEKGVDLALVVPSGPGGLITETDVKAFLEKTAAPAAAAPAPAPAAPAPRPQAPAPLGPDEEAIPLVGVRKTIAERMALSRRTAADVTTVAEVDMDEIASLREHVNFTYTAFVARAVVMALKEFPTLNSRLDENRIVVNKRIHLGVAVAIDEGLKVPVIRDAQNKGLRQIGEELAEKAQRGAEGKLTPEELTGSTFTLTNSGVFGSLLFTPIINPPESAILGMAKIMKTPVVRNDQIVIRRIMNLCLTYDHRVVDGAPAVKFLQRVKALLEKPALLL